MNSFDLKSRFE